MRTVPASGREDVRRGVHRDAGVSLIELLVVMMLFGLIGTLVTSLVISTHRQNAATRIRLEDVDQARVGMDALTRTLRTAVQPAQLQIGCTSCTGPASTATAVTTARSDYVQLFANFGSEAGPSLVTFTVGDDAAEGMATLTQKTQPPDAGSAPNYSYTACTVGAPGCAISRRTLVRGLTWPPPAPVFTYRDNTAAQLTPGGSGQLSPEQLIAIDAIDIRLPVRTPNPFGTAPVTLVGQVALPNAASGILPSPSPTPSGP
jgi:prepilin-type N-terminal cleavage/methylation domain-containing protein